MLLCSYYSLLQIDTGSSLEQLNNDEAFSGTGEVCVRNCIIGVYSMQLQSQIGSSGGVICSVDAIDAYMYQLQLYNAITTCDDSLRVFVVQDFSSESLTLKVNCNLTVS